MTQYTGKVGSTNLSDVSDFTQEASANQKTVIVAGSAPVAHLRHCYVTIGGLAGSAPLVQNHRSQTEPLRCVLFHAKTTRAQQQRSLYVRACLASRLNLKATHACFSLAAMHLQPHATASTVTAQYYRAQK
jgi:hypothetical protein